MTPNFANGKDIRLYGISGWLYNKYQTNLTKTHESYGKVFTRMALNEVFIKFTNVLQTVCVYIWLIIQIYIEQITIGEFTMFLGAINNFTTSITSVFSSCIIITNINKGLIDYLSFMQGDSNIGKGAEKQMQFADGIVIEFKNVSFKYPNSNDFVLKNINAKINKNEKIAIVGENGAGKSTFIKLLVGLYQPSSGEITINGINLRDLDAFTITQAFSVVFQDFNIFSFSVKENIILKEQFNEEKFNKIIVESGLSSFIHDLPKGSDTMISTVFDSEGIQLSGGQNQKIALARALYKNAPMVILDEPTSALDPRAESEMYHSFSEMVHSKSAIFITHRLASTSFCDRIIVLKNGEIIENGTHDQLRKKGGLYNELYTMQAELYNREGNKDD